MNEAFTALFSSAGPIGCVVIGCVALTAIGCFGVYMLIQKKRKESREEIDARSSNNETRLALLEQRVKNCEADLRAGTARFDSFDKSLKVLDDKLGAMSASVGELNGKFDLFLKMQGYVK